MEQISIPSMGMGGSDRADDSPLISSSPCQTTTTRGRLGEDEDSEAARPGPSLFGPAFAAPLVAGE